MTNKPPSILVLGGSGGLGQHICREVIRQFGPGALLVGDYKPERGRQTANRLGDGVTFTQVDVADPQSLRAALENGVSAVIVSVQQREPLAQVACIEAGIPYLDVTVQPDFIARVQQLDAQARAAQTASIVMAGLFPGLSGVMAKRAAEMLDHVDALDVALCQNSQSSAGVTGIADMLGLFAQPATFRRNGLQETVPGFTRKREFQYPPPFGELTHRLVNFVEAEAVSQELGIPDVNFWTGYDKPVFDLLLAALNKIGFLALFNRPGARARLARVIQAGMGLNPPESEPCSVIAEATGVRDGQPCLAQVSILAPSDYATTAMSVVAMAKLLLHEEVAAPGVHHPAQIFGLGQLLRAIDHDEVQRGQRMERMERMERTRQVGANN